MVAHPTRGSNMLSMDEKDAFERRDPPSVVEASRTEQRGRRLDASTDLAGERTLLAYDRTLLAWVRTATSLITFGFAIQQFFRLARAGAQERDMIGPRVFGLSMIVIGLVALLLATLDHWRQMLALQARFPGTDPYWSRATILAALVALLGLLGLASMLLHG
jgi:putative membrane protein